MHRIAVVGGCNRMITRRKFITQTSLLASAALLPAPLFSFAPWGEKEEDNAFEVVIIGGSYSGLSAAMALGRSLRKVLIIDNGKPCNRQSPHSHNFITQDGEQPGEIAGKAKAQVLKYETVLFHQDTVTRVDKSTATFQVTTKQGKRITAQKILFATGLKDILPALPGFADCWGISVLHCPYCHGYEVKGQPTGILANGDMAFHYVQLVTNLTDRLTIYTNGIADFSAEQIRLIRYHNIRIVEQKIKALQHENGQLKQLYAEDHSVHPVTVLYARPPVEQHSGLPATLGCNLTEQGLLILDNNQQTNIPGVYACGDNSAFRSVATAVATGSQAGAAINRTLSVEHFNLKQ